MDANYRTEFRDKKTGRTDTQGQSIDFKEQSVKRRIVITTKTEFFLGGRKQLPPKSNLLRLFFVCPELAENDVLYITDSKLFFDKDQNYTHMEITLESLSDQLESVGKTLNSLIKFNAPGERNPFPFIALKQEGNTGLYFEPPASGFKSIPNTKQVYFSSGLKDSTKGAKYFMFESNGLLGINSFNFLGRKKLGDNETLTRVKPIMVTDVGEAPTRVVTTNVSYATKLRPTVVRPQNLN